ncbi:MAG: hypothetical protein ACTSRZ_11430 [Promethearchaeota archaeon]
MWDNLVPIMIFYFFAEVLVCILIAWDHPQYGFSQFGPLVFISLIFLAIWFIIYVLCGKIAEKRKSIEST